MGWRPGLFGPDRLGDDFELLWRSYALSRFGVAFSAGAIAIIAVQNLGASALQVAVMFGASASFATPIGYQTNTLVYGAANYRFTDFLKIGIPMNLMVGTASCLAIYLLF